MLPGANMAQDAQIGWKIGLDVNIMLVVFTGWRIGCYALEKLYFTWWKTQQANIRDKPWYLQPHWQTIGVTIDIDCFHQWSINKKDIEIY